MRFLTLNSFVHFANAFGFDVNLTATPGVLVAQRGSDVLEAKFDGNAVRVSGQGFDVRNVFSAKSKSASTANVRPLFPKLSAYAH